MEPLDWQSNDRASFIRANGPDGEWTIRAEREGFTSEITYSRAFPEGETYSSLLEKTRGLDVKDEAWWTYGSYLHAQELGFGPGHELSKLLVERLRVPTPTDRTVDDILVHGGAKKGSIINVRGGIQQYDFERIGNKSADLTISVEGDMSISALYEPYRSQYFHYLTSIFAYRMSHDEKRRLNIYWPEGVDPLRATAMFIVEDLVPWIIATDMKFLHPRNRKKG